MNEELFDIDKFNVIQDEEYYYFFRALNMADSRDIEQRIIIGIDGTIDRIRTDRERYEEETKYKEDSKISLEEVYDHIKPDYRKDTNCISITFDANIALKYGAGYKDKYIMVKVPKIDLGKRIVIAGKYMLREICFKMMDVIKKISEDKRKKIMESFREIYTITSFFNEKMCNYKLLNEEQLLEINKLFAKLEILENEGILPQVITGVSNDDLIETVGRAFSSAELIHYGEITKEEILEISKEDVERYAVQQHHRII